MLIITFDANGGLLDATTMNAACFERVGKPPVPKKEGFSFLGWYTSLNPDEAEQVTEETVFEEARDITVYAWWSENTWSDWTSSLPEGVDDTNYFTESKEQSRYRDKQTTTSTNASLSGWTRTGSSTSYGSWGSWSDWTVNSVGGSDTREVRTAQVYGYYYFRCPNCGAHSHDAYHCYTWNDGCGYSGNLTWAQMWSTTSWNSAGLVDPHGTSKPYTDNLGGGRWYKYPESGSPKTGYSYRDRSKTITYTYERWGDWSAWSDTIYSGSGTRQVETRTVYRYRLK